MQFLLKVRNKISKIPIYTYGKVRIYIYKALSNAVHVTNFGRLVQPVLTVGRGQITLNKCHLGVWPSPYFLNGYIHIEARETTARIDIADNVWINNNAVIIAERSSISIGSRTLIGPEFNVFDSDFHHLAPHMRLSGAHICRPVSIGKNVFIGSRVTILKGVSIGDNCIIGSGTIVTKSIPANSIVTGGSGQIIKKIKDTIETTLEPQ